MTGGTGTGHTRFMELGRHQERGQIWREQMGIKWEVVRTDQITMGPQSQAEQLGPDGVGHGASGVLRADIGHERGCM